MSCACALLHLTFSVNAFVVSLALLLGSYYIAKYPLSTRVVAFPSVTTATSGRHLEFGNCTILKIPPKLFKFRSKNDVCAAHGTAPLKTGHEPRETFTTQTIVCSLDNTAHLAFKKRSLLKCSSKWAVESSLLSFF